MNSVEVLTPADPLDQISASEEAGMEVAAFLGAIDDLFEEFTSNQPDRRADEEIMQKIVGIRDQTSEFYSAGREFALSLFDQVTQRLGEMACNHDHFKQSLEAATGGKFDHDGPEHDHKDHFAHKQAAEEDDDDEASSWFGSSKKNKHHGRHKNASKLSLWSWFNAKPTK